MRLAPARCVAPEAQAQNVVVGQQVLHHFLQPRSVYARLHFQQHGLIEVVKISLLTRKEPALNGCERSVAAYASLLGFDNGSRPGDGSQCGDCLVLKKLSRLQTQPDLVCPRDDLNAQDRIATEMEEIIVNADAFHSEHLLPD